MDAMAWAYEAARKLADGFGERLRFVGLQGSRARGEEREDSDIDLVVLINGLTEADLRVCKAIIQSMPHAELACGFVGSGDVLARWPRHELFQFVHDTVPVCGQMGFSPTDFSRDDAREAARVGASGIYHAVCHAAVFDGETEAGILRQLAKDSSFVLRALHFARTGSYLAKKSKLAEVLSGEDAEVLAWSMRAKSAAELAPEEVRALSALLLRWSGDIVSGRALGLRAFGGN